MNIKNLGQHIIGPVESKSKVDGQVRTQGGAERDANGRREEAPPEIKHHLNDEEFAEALKILEESPGLKASSLTVKVEKQEGVRVVLVLSPDGKVVRRLSESQLWLATRNKDRITGRILDKAM
jgi:hypothetical protein